MPLMQKKVTGQEDKAQKLQDKPEKHEIIALLRLSMLGLYET